MKDDWRLIGVLEEQLGEDIEEDGSGEDGAGDGSD